jgi:hypothetical protein
MWKISCVLVGSTFFNLNFLINVNSIKNDRIKNDRIKNDRVKNDRIHSESP